MFRTAVACAPLYSRELSLLPETPQLQRQDPLLPRNDSYLIRALSTTAADERDSFTPSFFIKYDSWSRNPKWVVEHISSRGNGLQEQSQRRHMHFYPEPQIRILPYQTKPDDFKNSGYDRGHLAPSANYKSSNEHMRASFTMANVSPQDPGFNRGYWLKLEEWVRKLVKPANDMNDSMVTDVIVISGPAFLPTQVNGEWVQFHHVIGTFPRWIQVPTHFYKVVLKISTHRQNIEESKAIIEDYNVDVAAFLLPNKNIDMAVPLESFVLRIRDLESLVGATFFDRILSEEMKYQIDNFTSRQLKMYTIASLFRLTASFVMSCISDWGVIFRLRKHLFLVYLA